MQLSSAQDKAYDDIMMTLLNDNDRFYVLSGVAGSGKTTVVNKAVEELNALSYNVAALAFTGRAVSVLRNKGVHKPRTLHSFFYRAEPYTDPKTKETKFRFIPREAKDLRAEADFIIVDEASMVNGEMWDLIDRSGLKCIFVGDVEQLPPIRDRKDTFGNVMDHYHHHLTEIFRQAAENPIIRLSEAVRKTGRIPRIDCPEITYIKPTDISVDLYKERDIDVSICGFNTTRQKLNRLNRVVRGNSESDFALKGEQVMCLRNKAIGLFPFTRDSMVYNGELFEVLGVNSNTVVSGNVDTVRNGSTYTLRNMESNEDFENIRVLNDSWAEEVPEMEIMMGDDLHDFTFGYAMTVWKAQGSQFDNVLFSNENVSSFVDQKRFIYTAITRAKENLIIATF